MRLVALVCFAAAGLPAVAQQASNPANVGVMERLRPDYDAKGADLGGFRLFPSFDVNIAADDNVFQNAAPESDIYFEFAPALRLTSEWSQHALELSARLNANKYREQSSEDVVDWSVGGSGRLDIRRGSAFFVNASHAQLHEERSSPNLPGNIAEPARYSLSHVDSTLAIQPNRVGIALAGQLDRYSYDDVPLIGGGVLDTSDRDRNADLVTRGAWAGPPPPWWAQRFGIETDLAIALVCSAVRETFEESGVLFAGPAEDPNSIVGDAAVYRESRRALADRTLSFADFLRGEKLVLRSDLLRPWANWVTPEAERTRRYDTYFFVAALPEGQRADGENTESDLSGWAVPQDAIADFEAGRNVLLPPTWTQLDSLAGRSVAEVLAVERQIAPVQPLLEKRGDNWVFEFFDSDRYHRAREAGGSMQWPL